MKHVERRHFFVRDMVEKGEIEVPFVPTAANVADFFTKPMSNATQFFGFRCMVMNEGTPEARAARAAQRAKVAPTFLCLGQSAGSTLD